jgi:uncharacterized protein
MLIGHIEALYRYPVKSMAGEPLEFANLGWHGFEGDRRLALRPVEDRSGGFPFLTASKLPELLRYVPLRRNEDDEFPTHVRTPDGDELPTLSEALAGDIAHRHGAPLQMMHMRHGIFDEASLSVIASDTIREIGRLSGHELDIRRFRPNVVVRLLQPAAFQEDNWVGGTLSFGDDDSAPTIAVTMRDLRCVMVNFDPDTARPSSEIMKAIVRANQNNAGVYVTVIRTGGIMVGQPILLRSNHQRAANAT